MEYSEGNSEPVIFEHYSIPEDNDSVAVIEFVRDKDIDYFPKDFKTSVVRLYLGDTQEI